MTSKTHHLVTVWNPSYAQDAMDEQVRPGTETHLYHTDYRSARRLRYRSSTAGAVPRRASAAQDRRIRLIRVLAHKS